MSDDDLERLWCQLWTEIQQLLEASIEDASSERYETIPSAHLEGRLTQLRRRATRYGEVLRRERLSVSRGSKNRPAPLGE